MIKYMRNPLIFNAEVNKAKYSKVDNSQQVCPFCDQPNLKNILKTDGDKIWLMNKFVTIENSLMTVVIESAEHEGDITSYSQEENRELFDFTMKCWQETIDSQNYQSVLMFKNFGPMSGGSLRHPHFQIIGLEDVDGYEEVGEDSFDGLPVLKSENVSVNLSTHPIMGTVEINVILSKVNASEMFADAVQAGAQYLLTDFMDGRCDSYNLFFYQYDGEKICKIVPRFLTSPYFIGYKISQVYKMERLEEIANELKNTLKAKL